ncbi:retroviral-like aspartic protease family protein [Leptolyngbya sp. 15MV]|nr:retroviral-like aspartic protease family protein [Leptolyngbya sp. 15MV]
MLDATADRYDRMTVPVTIEGQGPFQFMIDTGAQATVVTRQLGDRLGLRPAGRATVVGMASRVPVDLVHLDGLEFAARVIDNLAVPALEARNVGADGILGLDSLQDLRVMIDFRDGTATKGVELAAGSSLIFLMMKGSIDPMTLPQITTQKRVAAMVQASTP